MILCTFSNQLFQVRVFRFRRSTITLHLSPRNEGNQDVEMPSRPSRIIESRAGWLYRVSASCQQERFNLNKPDISRINAYLLTIS